MIQLILSCVTLVYLSLCLHTLTKVTKVLIVDFGWVGVGRGLFEMFYSCQKCFLVLGKCLKILEKSNLVLKCI